MEMPSPSGSVAMTPNSNVVPASTQVSDMLEMLGGWFAQSFTSI